MTKNDLINYLNLPSNRIITIKNGFNNTGIKQLSEEEKRVAKANLGVNPDLPLILFIGSGFQRKGAFLLAKVAEVLPNIQIGIIGKDKGLHKFTSEVHSRKLQDRIFIYGPQKDTKPYLQAADIFCLPSLYDSFSNAVLEALAHGLPCVLTPNVGMHDAVQLFFAGQSCNRDIESIAHGIQQALKNQAQLSMNALSLSKKYSSENPNMAWGELYQSIMNAKGK